MSSSPLPPHSPLEHYYRHYRGGGDFERSGRSVDDRREFVIDLFDRTADGCVPLDDVLESLRKASFERVQRQVSWTVFSEYVAIARADG